MPAVSLTGIRVIVLDLDDTLYPERSFVESGFDAAAAWLKRQPEWADREMDWSARMKQLFDGGDRGHVFDTLLSELAVKNAERWVPTLVEVYRTHMPRITLFDDARQALERWAGRFRLALISDGPLLMQQRKVEALQLDRWIEHIVLTDTWGRPFWKPHHRAFVDVEQYFDAKPSECLYLADNPLKDFIAPAQRGWRSIRICRVGGIYADQEPPANGHPDGQADSLSAIDRWLNFSGTSHK